MRSGRFNSDVWENFIVKASVASAVLAFEVRRQRQAIMRRDEVIARIVSSAF
jgi:hypothetical protein